MLAGLVDLLLELGEIELETIEPSAPRRAGTCKPDGVQDLLLGCPMDLLETEMYDLVIADIATPINSRYLFGIGPSSNWIRFIACHCNSSEESGSAFKNDGTIPNIPSISA